MSKIAEKRTDEIVGEYHDGDYTDHSRHNTQWVAFKQGYDQSMQDFLEKAEKFISKKVQDYFLVDEEEYIVDFDKEECIKDFKNYMQNEEK